MDFRPYQEQAINKMLWARKLPGNDIVCIAQGGGKTFVIAGFVEKTQKPILILVPNKELLEQDLDKLKRVVPEQDIGVYSASMNSKEVKKYTLATIQSAYKHPEKFAHYEMVIIDECDLVNPKNLSGMYNRFFKAIGNPKIYGLTGTPFRQDVFYKYPPNYKGLIWQKMQIEAITTIKMINRYKQRFWHRMLYVYNTKQLLEKDYLTPLEYHDVSFVNHPDIPTNKSKSDFDMTAFSEQTHDKLGKAASYISGLNYKSKLVFCASITQAEELRGFLKDAMLVTSKTNKKTREKAVKTLKTKGGTLLNVGIYTVGFDYPELDCIILLRPTRSLRLHCQILGRVARKADNKQAGHVYDFVSNIKNLGKLEDIKITQVDNKWNVVSPSFPDGFHYQALYSFKLSNNKNL